MITFVLEIILYFVMAALIKQLTQVSGWMITLGFGLTFTLICALPGEWIILPLLLAALVSFASLRWGLPVYLAAALAVLPAIGVGWLMYRDHEASLTSDAPIPAELKNSISTILGQ